MPHDATTPSSTVFRDGQREYCRLIAELSKLNHDKDLWWATGVASRNTAVSTAWDEVRLLVAGGQPSATAGQLRPLATRAYWALRHQLTGPQRDVQRRVDDFLAAGPVDVVLCSHFTLNDFEHDNGTHRDAFWEPLIAFMEARRLRVLLLGIVVNDLEPVTAKLLADRSQNVCRVPLAGLSSLTDITTSAGMVSGGPRPELPSPCHFRDHDIAPVLRRHVDAEIANGLVWTHLQREQTLERILRRCRPRWLLWPWENHSWELLMLRAVRRDLPGTVTVGYTHSTLPPFLLNLFPGMIDAEACPLPDRIVTTGPRQRDVLMALGSFPADRVIPACATRYQALAASLAAPPTAAPPRSQARSLGVVLPLDPAIATDILAAAVAAIDGRDWQVRVRPHPLHTERDRQGMGLVAGGRIAIPEGESVQTYLSQVRAIVYCESTVGMESVASGVPTIRLDTPSSRGVLSDVMYECDALKWIASDSAGLQAALSAIDGLDPADYDRQTRAARAYVRDYFSPVTDDRLALFLPGLDDPTCRA